VVGEFAVRRHPVVLCVLTKIACIPSDKTFLRKQTLLHELQQRILSWCISPTETHIHQIDTNKPEKPTHVTLWLKDSGPTERPHRK
jgi:hypothetical protein